MVGSVDMAAIRTRLETSTKMIAKHSIPYNVVCNDLIDILGNAEQEVFTKMLSKNERPTQHH